MGEYISREAVQDSVQKHFDDGGFDGYTDGQLMMTRIRDIPAADVVEVRHGRWIKFSRGDVCSECQYQTGRYEHGGNYCPHCGAKMDGGQDDV